MRILLAWFLCLVACGAWSQSQGSTDYEEWQISLVTLGPGETYWERFGHNAILVEPPRGGTPYLYNFGLFDFQSENFLLNFAMGKMEYLAAAFDGSDEMRRIAAGNRSVRQQVLNLSPDQKRRIVEHLEWHRAPPNNTYLYDYYLQNCSTKVRDALDLALSGALRGRFESTGARFGSFRDHTHRLTGPEPWLYVATDLGLGRSVDRSITRWDEFFIPMELADAVAEIPDLVIVERNASITDPVSEPGTEPTAWPWFALAGLVISLLALALPRTFVAAYGSLSALVFCGMVALWALTDHQAAYMNQNLLLFTPLWLIALWKPRVALLAAALWIGALILQFLPASQDQSNWLAFTLIPAAACLWSLRSKRNSDPV